MTTVVDAAKRMERGRILYDQSRWVQAESEFRLALAEEAYRPSALYWIAWTQTSQSKLDEAAETAACAIAADPELASGYYVRAFVLRKQKRLKDGEVVIRQCLEKGQSVAYRTELAWNLVYQGRAAEALTVAEGALQVEPEAIGVHCVRTECLTGLERLAEARESALCALSIDPLSATSHAQLGALLFRSKDWNGAATEYAAALRLEPTYAHAQSRLLDALRARHWHCRALAGKGESIWVKGLAAWLPLMFAAGALTSALPVAGAILMSLVLLAQVVTFLLWFLGIIAIPISTLLLRLDPRGRAALRPEDIEASDYVAFLLVGATAAFVAALAGVWTGLYGVGLLLLVMTVPVTKTCQMQGVRKTVGEGCTWLLFSIGCGSVATIGNGMPAEGAGILSGCIIGALLFEPLTKGAEGMLSGLAGKHGEE